MKSKTFGIYLSALSTAVTLLGHGDHDESSSFYELDPVVVQSSPLAPEIADLTQAWCVHKGEELDWVRAQTIGETLAFDPGVTQSHLSLRAVGKEGPKGCERAWHSSMGRADRVDHRPPEPSILRQPPHESDGAGMVGPAA